MGASSERSSLKPMVSSTFTSSVKSNTTSDDCTSTQTVTVTDVKKKCSECGINFKSTKTLKKHLASVTDPRGIYKCCYCNHTFKTVSHCTQHESAHISGTYRYFPKSQRKSTSVQYQCNECDKKFMNESSLSEHLTSEAHEGRYQCSQCSDIFKTSDSCREHEQVHRLGMIPCCFCDLFFPSITHVRIHVQKVHQKVTRYRCDDCGAWFTIKYHLSKHQHDTQQNNPYKCLQCGHRYASELGLKRHQLIHTTKIKTFNCPICQTTFSKNALLQKHFRVSSRSCCCTSCQQSFSSKKYLDRHLRIHNADRPFRCDQCAHTFLSVGRLNSHKRVHSEGSRWKC